MVFVLTDWLRSTVGVDVVLLQAVNDQALQITANLPQVTDSVDLKAVHHQLVQIRVALGEVRRVSTIQDCLPGPDLTETELVLWSIGLARHLTQRRAL